MARSRQRLLLGRATPEPPAESAESLEEARYEAAWSAYCDVARERVTVGHEELMELVAARLGVDAADPATLQLVTEVEDDLMDDPAAPVTMLLPDVVVHAPALTDAAVLTHRLTAAELADEHLELDTDLAGFLRCPEPRVPAGPMHLDESYGDEPVRWGGPAGWLSAFPEGALLAVRAGQDGAVTISVLDAEPAAPLELVAALRAVYETELAEAGLPVPAETLVLGLLHRDRSAFAEPRPPLADLAAAAGLLQRGDEFAHDESVLIAAAAADREFRLVAGVETEEQGEAALRAFALLAADLRDPAALREALALMEDPDVLASVTEELLHEPDEDGERVRAAVALAERLVGVAGRTPREAVARYLAAVAAERDGRVLDAESHLRAAALAAEGWPLVDDRLAWYESDRGDAAAAAARWLAIEVPADDPDLAAVLPFATPAGREPGRNEPCWCGSGRKYKQCHAGRPMQPPLPARAGWLHRKAAAYVERRGGSASRSLTTWADVLDAAEVDDPAVVEAALTEDGWFARFLADRGPLLPADEAALAATWAAVRPSVYEVEGVRFGVGATLHDLRTGVRVDVAVPGGGDLGMGELLYARALPDGSESGHLLVGAVPVPRGTERDVLEQLDSR